MLSADTIIDHRQRIRRVMIHINQNLGEKFGLDLLSEVACFSPFHFLRVFESLIGETPQQYIIRKKMERAGFFLLEKKTCVTDVALGVGYGTSSSFCKVFKSHFGMSPRQFRDTIPSDQYHKTNHPFRSAVGNRNRSLSMPLPVIRKLPVIKIICIKNQGVVNGNFLASNLKSFDIFREQVIHNDLIHLVQNSVSIYPNRPTGTLDSQATDFIGAIIKHETRLSDPFRYFVFPPGKYAIFTHYGSYDFISLTWNQAYMNWFPKSGETLRDLPPLEIHMDESNPDDTLGLKAYLLIPIR